MAFCCKNIAQVVVNEWIIIMFCFIIYTIFFGWKYLDILFGFSSVSIESLNYEKMWIRIIADKMIFLELKQVSF